MTKQFTVEELAALDAEIDAAFDAAYDNPAYAKVAHWTLPNCAPEFNGDGYVQFLIDSDAEYVALLSGAVEDLGRPKVAGQD